VAKHTQYAMNEITATDTQQSCIYNLYRFQQQMSMTKTKKILNSKITTQFPL